MSVRVRYAPSPTGLQHIGGIRTALFNYFFARANGGRFILRIEDTDQERTSPEALEDLYSTLEWLGIEYDEGPEREGEFEPYIQSQRKHIYKEKADELLQMKHAYPCFCSSERLNNLREQQKAQKKDIGYDRKCRDIPEEESASRIAAGEDYVLRLKVPLEGKTEFTDVLCGRTGRKNRDISPDPVIVKTDGFPTYHLANVIDDHVMNITHVLRAQEWIPSCPLHVLIYKAFSWDLPQYCHLPMVMGKDGKKLSKRHGATSILEFRKAGYLPEALMNFVALLGWSYDDSREFFSRDELCRLFSLEKINQAPAVFDYRKLDWFNGQYIRRKNPGVLKDEIKSFLIKDGIVSHPPSAEEQAILDGAFPIIRERLKLLNDASPMLRFLFMDPGVGNIEDAIPKKNNAQTTATLLTVGIKLLEMTPPIPQVYDEDACMQWDEMRDVELRAEAQRLECKVGEIMQPLRLAITASKVSPPLFPAIRLLGIQESIRRANRLLKELEKIKSY